MSSILLIGNGFTSCLIPTYKNEHMMSKVKEVAPEIFKKADDLFTPFRKKTEPLLYDAHRTPVGIVGEDEGSIKSGLLISI